MHSFQTREFRFHSGVAAIILLASTCSFAAGTSGTIGGLATAPAGRSFLIVAPRPFQEALKEYVIFKQKHMQTEMIVLEDILKNNDGADDPERLKHFLYTAWKQKNVGYVLLVGDADVFPVRYMTLDRITPAAFDYAFYPSDLYYADVAKPDGSFDDWNAHKEDYHAHYFGEVRGEKNKNDPMNYDAVDYKPELAVGRWPVSSSEEVGIVARKSMKYEQSLTSIEEARHAAFIMIGGWVDVRDRMDAFASTLPKGWTIEKRYYADKGQTPQTPPPNEQNVVDLLNSGTRLMLHAGHGNDDRWEQSISVHSLKKLHNADRLAVLLSAGCSTARFATLPPYEPYVDLEGKEHKGSDHGEVFKSPPPPPSPYQKGKYNPPGLGEQLLREGPGGAVAYIGCNTGSQPCAVTLLEGFINTLAQSKTPSRVGDCWNGAISYYYDHERLATIKPDPGWYPASIFFQAMKYMFYGDPTLPIGGPS